MLALSSQGSRLTLPSQHVQQALELRWDAHVRVKANHLSIWESMCCLNKTIWEMFLMGEYLLFKQNNMGEVFCGAS